MPQPDPTPDLNTVITSAVQARVEASVIAALADADFFKTYVINALNAPVEVSDGTSYGKKKIPFMSHLIAQAIREATKTAVQGWINAHSDDLAELVEAELDRESPRIAREMVGRMREKANDTYGLHVELRWPGEGR